MLLTRLSVVITPAVILMLLAPTLAGVDRLAFRDVGHFYTPLYEYVAARTQNEWIPLWNPLDQTGVPLVGETSTAVFYPVRYLLFSLPIAAEVAMAWYVALHLIFASLAARTAARWAGATARSASVAGVIYPLSGSVLFLHTNPPFLVGAAWLPLVLGALLPEKGVRHLFQKRCLTPFSRSPFSRCLIAGVAMAMMVLGGDPQTALHAMMVVSAVWLWRVIRSTAKRSQARQPGLRFFGLVVIGVPILAAALSAPQIAASLSWSRQSDRIRGADTANWLRRPTPGSHHSDAFQFSVPPWHFAELMTPNAFGSHLPINRRLSVLIPDDGRMWTPSLYMGMLAAIAMFCRVARWRSDGVDVWSATAAISLLFCLGSFGAVWFVQVCTGSLSDYDGAAGGAYWCLYHFVPGYSSFRYPAKWLPMFSIAASVVTARWLDRDAWNRWAVTTGAIVAMSAMLLIACVIVSWLRIDPKRLAGGLVTWPTDRYFGPLDAAGGLFQIQWSLFHSIIVLVMVIMIMGIHRIQRCSRPLAVRLLFAVVLVDVAVSGATHIAGVPIQEEQALLSRAGEVAISRKVDEAGATSSSMRRMRTQSEGGWPRTWRQTRDPQRLRDVAASERIAEFGRWHLPSGRGVLNNVVSIQNHDMARFWNAAAQLTSKMTLREQTEFWHCVRRWLSIEHVIYSTARAQIVELPNRISTLVDVQQVDEPSGSEVFQFHTNWTQIDPQSATLPRFVELLDDVRAHGEAAKPLVITSEEIPEVHVDSRQPAPEIEIVVDQPSRIEIDLQGGSPGLLMWPTYQDGHWIAECQKAGEKTWSPLEVHRVNFLAQGVLLPPRCEAVRFIYQPFWLRAAVALSGLAWSVVSIRLLLYARKIFCGRALVTQASDEERRC